MSAHRVNIPAAAVPGLSRAAAVRGMSIASYAAGVLLDHALGLDGTATAPAIDPAAVPIPLVTVRLAGDIADADPAQLWTRGHGVWRIGRLTRSLVRHLGVAQASRSVQGVWRISGWEQAEDGRFEAIERGPAGRSERKRRRAEAAGRGFGQTRSSEPESSSRLGSRHAWLPGLNQASWSTIRHVGSLVSCLNE